MAQRNLSPFDRSDTDKARVRTDLDRQLLDVAFRENWRTLVAYAFRLLGDLQAAEDVVQRAMIRLWDREGELPPAAGLRPLLYRAVRNLVANEWRDARVRSEWLDDVAFDQPCSPAADIAYHAAELEAALEGAIERLPARRREVFILSRYHALSNGQIAQVLELSPQTVANQLVSALRDLRQMLSAHLGVGVAPLRIVRGKEAGPKR